MSSLVPDGWSEDYISEYFDFSIGGTPSRNNELYWDANQTTSNIWVSIRDLKDKFISDSAERISDLGVSKSNVKLLPKNTVLMSFKLSIGRLAISMTPLYTNEAIVGFIEKRPNTVDRDYLYYGLQSWNLLGEVDQAVKGATLNKDKMSRIIGIFPPLPEQKKIASILTSVDEVIENTQEQIDKLQDLKKATMNELLTKGIGHTEFKDSELGRIPKSWEVVNLRSLALQIKRGPSLSCNTNGHGVRYITSGNLVSGEVSLNGDYKFLDNFSDIEKCRLVANDLVLNCVNSSAKIGESAIFELDIEAIVGFNNYAITLDSAICVPRFIHYFCQINLFRAQLKTVIKDAINQVSFSTKDLDLIRIALPTLDEQYRIAESINVIWMKEKTNQSQIDKLKSLKKSLMQDLLTGKVRVTVN